MVAVYNITYIYIYKCTIVQFIIVLSHRYIMLIYIHRSEPYRRLACCGTYIGTCIYLVHDDSG